MRFARREIQAPSVDLTPLIDVVFLLLIFFMVTTRFVDAPKLSLKLPSAGAAAQAPHRAPIVVVVDARNRYYVGGEIVAPRQLASVLAVRHARHRNRGLVLRADSRATHGAVVRVLDIAADQGFERVDIAVKQPGG